MQLHRRAQETLQQRVMQFLSDSRPLLQALLKAEAHSAGFLPEPQSIEGPGPGNTDRKNPCPEPPCLPDQRIDSKGNRRLLGVPAAIRSACGHAQTIRTGGEVGVRDLSHGDWANPSPIVALEHVAIA